MWSIIFLLLSAKSLQVYAIFGGRPAEEAEFPYMVSIRTGSYEDRKHICGGSIISKKWILTAAHCITESLTTTYYIHAGTNMANVNVFEISADVQVLEHKRYVIHPDFKGGLHPHDLALIELDKELKFNNKVKPVKLPKAEEHYRGMATLSGWGSMSRDDIPIFPTMLQTVDVPIYNYETCRWLLNVLKGTPKPLNESNLCTGSPRKSPKSACYGDFGSPLVIWTNETYKKRNVPMQIGIASWGKFPCGSPMEPTVHTRVSAFIEFIAGYVKDLI